MLLQIIQSVLSYNDDSTRTSFAIGHLDEVASTVTNPATGTSGASSTLPPLPPPPAPSLWCFSTIPVICVAIDMLIDLHSEDDSQLLRVSLDWVRVRGGGWIYY